MKKRKLCKVHLCAQLDGEGKVWSLTSESTKRGVAFFKHGRFSNYSEDLYLILETRTYDFFAEDPKAAIVLPENVSAKLVLKGVGVHTEEVSFDGHVGKILDSKYLLDVGQTMSGCSIIGKWHPNYERYILVPPTKIFEDGIVPKLEENEIILIKLEQKLCPYGTKWFASETTTGKSGFVTLRDARFMDEGKVIFTRYIGDDNEGRAIFKKPFKSVSDENCDLLNIKVFVKHKIEGRSLWDGNLMRIVSVAEDDVAKMHEVYEKQDKPVSFSLAGAQVLLDLHGERVSESILKDGKGLQCRIIGSRGDCYIAEPIW